MQFRALTDSGKVEFTVPSNAVDLHIKSASGIYFKILLVLLRNESNNLTSERICELTGIPKDEIDEAVRYWIRCKILPESVIDGIENKSQVYSAPDKVTLDAKEISKLKDTNCEIAFLFTSAELIFARPITATEQKALVSMHEWLGLPVDVILMLIDYCFMINKKSIRYIEKVAVGWADSGIITHELAEEKIKALKEADERSSKVKSAFGIYGRSLTATELKYIKKWFETYEMPFDMIMAAYEITVSNTGKISFAYIDKILVSWSQKGYKTVQETHAEKKKSTKGINKIQFENDSFDVNNFEDMGLYDIPDVK